MLRKVCDAKIRGAQSCTIASLLQNSNGTSVPHTKIRGYVLIRRKRETDSSDCAFWEVSLRSCSKIFLLRHDTRKVTAKKRTTQCVRCSETRTNRAAVESRASFAALNTISKAFVCMYAEMSYIFLLTTGAQHETIVEEPHSLMHRYTNTTVAENTGEKKRSLILLHRLCSGSAPPAIQSLPSPLQLQKRATGVIGVHTYTRGM